VQLGAQLGKVSVLAESNVNVVWFLTQLKLSTNTCKRTRKDKSLGLVQFAGITITHKLEL
jgi:hypothetical protein